MIQTNMDLSGILAKHCQGAFPRGIARAFLQLIAAVDVEELMGERRGQRDGACTSWSDGRVIRESTARPRSTPSITEAMRVSA